MPIPYRPDTQKTRAGEQEQVMGIQPTPCALRHMQQFEGHR
jgi:hypothetical protein